jgi:uncharacterized protein YrrD
MLKVISPLRGFVIEATDGRIGTVDDFLFDDTSWKVRWIVVDCGTWLTGRKVLIHPSVISYAELGSERFEVSLSKGQVRGSPSLSEHQPVSKQMESQLYDYYGWDPLWNGPYPEAMPGEMSSPLLTPPYFGRDRREPGAPIPEIPSEDTHLRSVAEVTGYHIRASDGEIGHVHNFMLDDADWSLRYFIVDTSNWWFGKRVLIAPHAVKSIDWSVREVVLDVTREQVQASPPWDPLVAFNDDYKTRLHQHYGWPGSGI